LIAPAGRRRRTAGGSFATGCCSSSDRSMTRRNVGRRVISAQPGIQNPREAARASADDAQVGRSPPLLPPLSRGADQAVAATLDCYLLDASACAGVTVARRGSRVFMHTRRRIADNARTRRALSLPRVAQRRRVAQPRREATAPSAPVARSRRLAVGVHVSRRHIAQTHPVVRLDRTSDVLCERLGGDR